MAFSPASFKSQLQYGGVRSNLFEIRMAFPSIAGDTGASTKLTFTAQAASLPASSVPAIEVPYFGRVVHVSGDRVFAPWTINVINDEDFIVRNAFERWMNAIKAHSANTTSLLQPDSYKVDAEVIQYGKDSRVIKTYKFVGVMPTEVSEVALSWADNNTIQNFTVVCSIDWWEAETSS